MLEFIYSDKVKEEGDLDLLRLAEKFQIRGLIKRCGRSLATTVNLDNAFDLLDAVSSQPDGPLKFLKDSVLHFCADNYWELRRRSAQRASAFGFGLMSDFFMKTCHCDRTKGCVYYNN